MTIVTVIACLNIIATFGNVVFATRNVDNARRNLRKYIELTSDCPSCRHYGSYCDVCAAEKRSTE